MAADDVGWMGEEELLVFGEVGFEFVVGKGLMER